MTYQGIFMREYVGQTADAARTGWSQSPDIIPWGTGQTTDDLTTPQSYATDPSQGHTVTMQAWNYVYLRGVNTAPGPQDAKIYLYYVESALLLWPCDWRGGPVQPMGTPDPNMMLSGLAQNFVPVHAAAQNQVVVPNPTLLWYPPAFTQPNSDHYCMVTWVDNGNNPPPDFSQSAAWGQQELTDFIVGHPNVTTHNTCDVYAQGPTRSNYTIIKTKDQSLQVYITVTFSNIPADGTFTLNIPGPTPDQNITVARRAVPTDPPTLTYIVTYPPKFQTMVNVQYFQGATPVPAGANIKVMAMAPGSSNELRDLQDRHRHVRLPVVTLLVHDERGRLNDIVQGLIVGTQVWNQR